MGPKLTTLSGEITDIFAHRFVIDTDAGKILADLGPKGAETAMLKVGERVDVTGEMKPSELKVGRLVRAGQAPVVIDHDKPKPKHGAVHGPHGRTA